MRTLPAALVLLVGTACSSANTATSSTTTSPTTSASNGKVAPALDAITSADIRRDLFAMGGDAMRGREAGTLDDEMRATGWVAERAREAGLQPAGDDGTFFQWWPIHRTRLSESSIISVGDKPLRLWKDAVVLSNQYLDIKAPIVFIADSAALATTDVRGKAVAMELPSITTQPQEQFTIRGNFQGAISQMVRARASAIAQAGGVAAILLSNGNANIEAAFDATAALSSRGTYAIDSAGGPAGQYARPAQITQAGRGNAQAPNAANGGGRGRGNAATIPTLWLRRDMLETVKSSGARLAATIFSESFYYPSGNVIGVVRGTDPRLANEYVVFSGHQDHDGTRYPVNGDSIWNGADDNTTISVALLASARAFVKHPAPRPVLFIWHGAEERGLLGSRWYVNHPTVPHSQIIAVLNGDMIGRNNPDSAALLGVQAPHRNSNALVEAALRANNELTHFKLDTMWDKASHPEGWYFRSDHLPYARAGIPAIMFSTLLHPDYHTPRDEPSRIDIAKLTKMTQWMYATGWLVAAAKDRPDVIPGFKLER